MIFLAIFLGLIFSFSFISDYSTKFYVNKTSIVKDADLGFFDLTFLKFIGNPQNGPIEPFIGTKADFLYKIAKSKDWKITLIPGETTEIFLRNISSDYNLSLNSLKHAYYEKTQIPDGVLFPETYFIKRDSNESAIIERLYGLSMKMHEKLSNELLGKFDKAEWFGKVIPKASVIQKEAVNASEMPLISSVIDNRIKINMPLQMDGSLNYGIYSHQKITPARIKDDTSTYNTYKKTGLPSYPVCSVSSEAIKAAINPAKTDYLYFMRNSSGTHSFTKDYNSHLKEINKVKLSNSVR